MKYLLVVNLLAVLCLQLSESATAGNNALLEKELLFQKSQAKIVFNLLVNECPEMVKVKREAADQLSADIQVQKLHYQSLLQQLLQCRKQKQEMTTTTTATTTERSQRPECYSATNLTEAWRTDNGSGIRPGGPHSANGYACDLHDDLQWFRFTGAAGTS